MVTMVDPTGNRSAARSASGSSQIWVYTRRRNQNAKSLSQMVASASPLVLRTASAISWVFIHPSNQQSDKAIARSLQFCDSRQKRKTYKQPRFVVDLRGPFARAPTAVTPLSREHPKEGARDTIREGHGCPPIKRISAHTWV